MDTKRAAMTIRVRVRVATRVILSGYMIDDINPALPIIRNIP